VSQHLRGRPVGAGVRRARHQVPVEPHLEREVKALLADVSQVGQRLRVPWRRADPGVLQRLERHHPGRDRRRERLGQERAERLRFPGLQVTGGPVVEQEDTEHVVGESAHRDRPGRARADYEADLGLEVEAAGRAERRPAAPPALPARARHRRTGRHDGARPAVVADGHVLPVRRERLTVRPEYPPGVGRVVLVAEEVDVVARREGQVQAHLRQRPQRRLDRAAVPRAGQEIGDLGPDLTPAGAPGRHEGVQRRLGEHVVAQCPGEVQDRVTDPGPDPGAFAFAFAFAFACREHPVGQVGQAEFRAGWYLQPGRALCGQASSPFRCRVVSPT